MKAYRKALLNVEEFVLNADIASASDPNTDIDVHGQQGGGGLNTVGVEFEIVANGNDEI